MAETAMSDIQKKSVMDALLDELQCVVCTEYMLPPIMLCEKGHNVCSSCKPRLQHCPTCRSKFLGARNISLENVCRLIELPCKNRKWGCPARCVYDILAEHENDCEYGQYDCPVPYDGKACPWKGLLTEMKTHLKATHASEVSEVAGTLIFERKFGAKNENYSGIIITLDEVFQWFLGCTESYVNMLHGYVKYIGPKKHSSRYMFEISIKKEGDINKMGFRHRTLCYDDQRQNIVMERRCLKAEYKVIELFLSGNNSLSAEIVISKI